MRKFLFVVFLALIPVLGLAQSSPVQVNGDNVSINAPGSTGDVSLVPGSSGGVGLVGSYLKVATPVTSSYTASGTPVATPSFSGGIVAIPTVAANGAVDMPIPVASMLGKLYVIINQNANASVLWPSSGVTINGGASASLATGTMTFCILTSLTTWWCGEAAKA